MTTKEQISAIGAQLYAKEKMLDKHLRKKDIQTFKTMADALHKEGLKLVETYPDYIHSYVVYYHVASSISEKYASLQTENDSAHAVELLALSLMKLTGFVYPDKLKHESATNLCMANAFQLCDALADFSQKNHYGYRDLIVMAIRIVHSLYIKALAFNPDTAILKKAEVFLKDIHDDTSDPFALSKTLMVSSCDAIWGAAKAHVLLNKNDNDVKNAPSNPPAPAPAKTLSSPVSVPTPTKVAPPRSNAPSYTPSYSYRESWWSRFKDKIGDFNDMIEDLGKWFYYNVYEAGEIGGKILVGGIIIASVIGVFLAWANDGFGMALLAAFIGSIVCYVFMGIGRVVLELFIEGIMYIFRYLFYNAWTLLWTIVFVAMIITLSMLSSGNISSSDNFAEPQEYITPATQTYCCTANTVLNIRSAPDGSANVIGTLKSGQHIQVYNIVDGYAKFDYRDGYGYVSTKYLKMIE